MTTWDFRTKESSYMQMKKKLTLGLDPGGPRDFGQHGLYQVTFIGDSDGERGEMYIPAGEAGSERDLDVSEYRGVCNSACLTPEWILMRSHLQGCACIYRFPH